jgi:MYXO-CTERM domain-containing protein
MSPTPGVNLVAVAAPAGTSVLVLQDATGVPARGTLRIGSDPTPIEFVRESSHNTTLKLLEPLPHDVQVGVMVTTLAFTPTARVVQVTEATGNGSGCAIGTTGGQSAAVLLLSIGIGGALLRRRRDQ